jgi:hypothetical protein
MEQTTDDVEGPLIQGDFAMDTATGRVGIVQLITARWVQLHPLDLGGSWDSSPSAVRRLTAREYLSARVAVVNESGRRFW